MRHLLQTVSKQLVQLRDGRITSIRNQVTLVSLVPVVFMYIQNCSQQFDQIQQNEWLANINHTAHAFMYLHMHLMIFLLQSVQQTEQMLTGV